MKARQENVKLKKCAYPVVVVEMMLLSSLLSLLLLPLFYLQLNFYFSSALIFHRHRSASPVRALEGRSASSGFYVATAAPCELLSV